MACLMRTKGAGKFAEIEHKKKSSVSVCYADYKELISLYNYHISDISTDRKTDRDMI